MRLIKAKRWHRELILRIKGTYSNAIDIKNMNEQNLTTYFKTLIISKNLKKQKKIICNFGFSFLIFLQLI